VEFIMGYLHEDGGYSGLSGLGCGASCRCSACKQHSRLAECSYEGEGRDPPRLRGYGLGDGGRPDFMAELAARRFLGEAPMPARAPPPAVPASPMVRVANALVAPFRCICRVVACAYDRPGFSVGTGFLVGPYHVLTCAHCIYPLEAPRTKTIDVYPAQNGPFESAVRFRANGWAVRAEWRLNDCRTAAEDYGIIRLADPAPHGYFPLRPFDPTILRGRTVQLAGYPGERERYAQHMYRSEGRAIGTITIEDCRVDARGKERLVRRIEQFTPSSRGLFAHELAGSRAVSGGPMWIEENGARTLIGIHARSIDDDQRRAGVLLDEVVRAQVAQWMNRELPPLRR
jgi:V8-like Glu-specific endopeptidase